MSYLAPDIVRALLKGRQPLTPGRLLRLSKDLPHDWNEQGQFLGFAGTINKFRPERSITPTRKQPRETRRAPYVSCAPRTATTTCRSREKQKEKKVT